MGVELTILECPGWHIIVWHRSIRCSLGQHDHWCTLMLHSTARAYVSGAVPAAC